MEMTLAVKYWLRVKTDWRVYQLVVRARELCESRGGRPGLPSPPLNSPYGPYGRKATLN